MHPLKIEYCNYVKDMYGNNIWGDDSPERTEKVSQRVHKLGINYKTFVECAVKLWDVWSKKIGHPYPYWNMVTSDKTFMWMENLLDLQDVVGHAEDDSRIYEYERLYAEDYLSWLLGEIEDRPYRSIKSSLEVRILVAADICENRGIKFITSDYNYIASQVRENGS